MKNSPFHPNSPSGRCYQLALDGDIWEYERLVSDSAALAESMVIEFGGTATSADYFESLYDETKAACEWESRFCQAVPEAVYRVTGPAYYCGERRETFIRKADAIAFVRGCYMSDWNDFCQGTGGGVPNNSFTIICPDGSMETV